MNPTITATLDVWELVWLVLAVIGMVSHLIGFRKAYRFLKEVTTRRVNGPVLREGRKHFRNEASRFVKQTGFFTIGIIAATNVPGPSSWKAFVSRCVFVGIEVLMIYNSIKDNYDYDKSVEEVPQA